MCTSDARGPCDPRASRTAPEDVVIDAPAKINLYLEILGQRPDGYHEIDTVMQTVSLADTLTLRARRDGVFALEVRGHEEGVPSGGTNLVTRAARALAERLARSPGGGPVSGADIVLEKRVPTGAGLGGGSSDAAATLVGLRRLWGADIADELLLEVASELGSDVPFFVCGGAARCTGRGEIVTPLEAEGRLHAVLVPGKLLGTKDVYTKYSEMFLTAIHKDDMLTLSGEGTLRLGDIGEKPLRNDLEPAAFSIRPELRDMKHALLRAGALQACMSGSGSCVYGIASSSHHAEHLSREIAASGRRCIAVESVGPR